MSPAAISLLVLAGVVVLFVSNILPVEVVAVGSALVLYFTGVISLPEALSGFGDATVVLIAALFVVSEGLEATGVTTWVGQVLVRGAGESVTALVVLTMALVAVLTAFINLNGAVAALVPMVVVVAVRKGIAPSRLLMPLAFAGSAGSLLLLTGSPVNVVVSDSAVEAGVGAFGFVEFAVVGVPLVLGTMAIVVLFGDRLVPQRVSESTPVDLSAHASTLISHYALDRLAHLRVPAGSSLLGARRDRWALADYPGIDVVTVLDARSGRPRSDGVIAEEDRLSVIGDSAVAERFRDDHGLRTEAVLGRAEVADALVATRTGAVEVVVPPRSQFVGESVRPGGLIGGDRIVVLAVHRQGRLRRGIETELHAGDAVLLEGPWPALDAVVAQDGLLIVDQPDLVRRQSVPLGTRSGVAIAVLSIMVVLLATGAVPPVVAALLAAGAMIVFRVLTVQQAYRRIHWTTVLLVAGMIPLSTAIRTSGAGDAVARIIVDAVGDSGPYALLLALFALTVTFGQLISNTATALVVIPIAISAAQQLDISARPVLMCVLVASAASFLTPVATPANMMIMAPAGYRFGDYWKLGLPMIGLFLCVAVGLVPVVWRF